MADVVWDGWVSVERRGSQRALPSTLCGVEFEEIMPEAYEVVHVLIVREDAFRDMLSRNQAAQVYRDKPQAEVERLRKALELIANGGYSGASFLAHEALAAREEVGRGN